MRKFLVSLLFLFAFFCAPRKAKKVYILKKEIKEPVIRVLLAEGENPIWIRGTFYFYIYDKTRKKKYKLGANEAIKIQNKDGKAVVYLNGKKTKLNFPLIFYVKEEKGYVIFNGNRYRGKIYIDRFLRVLNIIKVEDYLKSVVPPEMGHISLETFNALKAQAVIARTYAIRKYLERKGNFFHLYADIRDQVYKGRDFEKEISNIACNETKGEVLMYGKEVVLALYHSTCGGKTAYYDEVFPAKERMPYLISRRCNFQGKDLCSVSPYYRWKIVLKREEFRKKISRNISSMTGIDVAAKDILDIRVDKRGRSGRVKEVKIKTKRGVFEFEGYEVRKVLNLGRILPSSLFNIIERGKNVIIKGKGFGHGVGLCQYGALELAKKGVNYERILRFYYSGTKIKKLY